jgi:hypothetical protein
MFSPPDPDSVLADLGDKLVQSFIDSVEAVRTDLDDFRAWQPGWFPMFSSRFLANFIHERLWAGIVTRFEGTPGIHVHDAEPRRELHVGTTYAIRLKRHRPGWMISTYPTDSALAFWSSASTLPTLESISLALGYEWDGAERRIGDPVLSFRDAVDKPRWQVRLLAEGGGTSSIGWEPVGPRLPEFDLSHVVEKVDPASGGDR